MVRRFPEESEMFTDPSVTPASELPLRVLVLEDNPFQRSVAVNMLRGLAGGATGHETLGMSVVIEGIETDAQRRELLAWAARRARATGTRGRWPERIYWCGCNSARPGRSRMNDCFFRKSPTEPGTANCVALPHPETLEGE